VPVTMGVTMHPIAALAAGTAFLATSVPLGAGVPLSTVATFPTYAFPAYQPAYSLYVNHYLCDGSALARPARTAIRWTASADTVGVHTGTSAGFAAGAAVGTPTASAIQCYEHAGWDGHAGAIRRYERTDMAGSVAVLR